MPCKLQRVTLLVERGVRGDERAANHLRNAEYKFGEDFHEMWRKALDGQRDIPIDERRILSRLGELLGML